MAIDDCRVTLNDNELTPEILSLEGRPQEPAPGDVLLDFSMPAIVLGRERTIRLRSAGGRADLVVVEAAPGRSQWTIACRVYRAPVENWEGPPPEPGDGEGRLAKPKGPHQVLVNPLRDLSAGEIAVLRGVRLEAWGPDLEGHLARIEPEECVVSIESAALRPFKGGLPPLPRDLRYLLLEFRSYGAAGRFDMSSLSNFPELRVLVVHSWLSPVEFGTLPQLEHVQVLHVTGVRSCDFGALSAYHDLRDLDVRGCGCVDDGVSRRFSKLTRLRRLTVAGCEKLTSIEFSRQLRELEFLDLSRTCVADLSPLENLMSLRDVVAIETRVGTLPRRRLPNLLSFNVMSSGLSADEVGQFRELQPATKILHCWIDAFREAVGDADYVRVRSGGTCHRRPQEEETLVEETDRGAIEDLAGAFEIDERASGGCCNCCGSPTIEFHHGGRVIAMVGLHHGRSARWKGWPGDAALSLRSRDRLAAWLCARRERLFAEAHHQSRSMEVAGEALVEDCLAVLPPKSASLWRGKTSRRGRGAEMLAMLELAAASPSVVAQTGPSMLGQGGGVDRESMAEAIRAELGDPVEMATVAFRLLGCGEGSWNQMPHGGLHQVALDLLEATGRRARGSALNRVGTDHLGWEGAVRWLLYHGGLERVPRGGASVERALLHALSHPRDFNRKYTLALLGTGQGPLVVAVSREVLNGLPVRSVDPRYVTEPGGLVARRGGDAPSPEGASDSAFAAQILGRLADQDSYTKICDLASEAPEPSRSVLLKAKAALEQRAVEKPRTWLARLGTLVSSRRRLP